MINKELNQKEIVLLTKCSEQLNGFSRSFRDLWAEKNQEERIKFMEMLVAEYEEQQAIISKPRVCADCGKALILGETTTELNSSHCDKCYYFD